MLKSIEYHLDCDNSNIQCHLWLKSIKDRVQPQQKQEWSEEDEQEFNFIIKFLNEKHLWSSIGWLRALKDMCLLQQQEFSEDDKTYLNHVVTAVKSYYTDYEGKENPFREPLLDWLKSLRPQNTWKPSDEQMKGIECAIKTLRYQLNVGDKRLNSLYQDLKKLREE